MLYYHAIELNQSSFWLYYKLMMSFVKTLYEGDNFYKALSYYKAVKKLIKLSNGLYKNKCKKLILNLFDKYEYLYNDVIKFYRENNWDLDKYISLNKENVLANTQEIQFI
ncbi:MAG: hypothetical protein AAGJ08_11415 [Cyanobacteria bacterium P01_H01_bin.35]